MRDDLHPRFASRSRDTRLSVIGSGALRVALLFSTAGVGMALILTPMADRSARPVASNLGAFVDPIVTGSIGANHNGYTLRRSVLQASPDAVCVINAQGARSGNC